MGTNSHGRGGASFHSLEIFTDDTEPAAQDRRPPAGFARREVPQSPGAGAPFNLFDEEEVADEVADEASEEVPGPVPPRTVLLAADAWSDVHPEPIALPRQAGSQPQSSGVLRDGRGLPRSASIVGRSGDRAKPHPGPVDREREQQAPLAIENSSDRTAGDTNSHTDPEPTCPDHAGGWTIPMLCAGIAIIAACLLVPLAEENHQLVYQRERLKLDLTQIKKQVAVNEEFLKRINGDPMLAERLAQRQMKTIRLGEAVLELPSNGREEMSPFMLVTVPPPAPMQAYRPVGGVLAAATRYPRTRLFLLGGGLFLIMFGLVLGYSKE